MYEACRSSKAEGFYAHRKNLQGGWQGGLGGQGRLGVGLVSGFLFLFCS